MERIGFVGLVAPHVARLLVGHDQRKLLPVATALGAICVSSITRPAMSLRYSVRCANGNWSSAWRGPATAVLRFTLALFTSALTAPERS